MKIWVCEFKCSIKKGQDDFHKCPLNIVRGCLVDVPLAELGMAVAEINALAQRISGLRASCAECRCAWLSFPISACLCNREASHGALAQILCNSCSWAKLCINAYPWFFLFVCPVIRAKFLLDTSN